MEDKRSPSKPKPTTATVEQLLAHYNSQVDSYNQACDERFAGEPDKARELHMQAIPLAELVVSKDLLIDRIRRQNHRLGRHIRARGEELLMAKKPDELHKGKYSVGMTYQEILNQLAVEFPEASTSVACLRWYVVHMRSDATEEGRDWPDLPQFRPRSGAKKVADGQRPDVLESLDPQEPIADAA